jgi:hypothetical protein
MPGLEKYFVVPIELLEKDSSVVSDLELHELKEKALEKYKQLGNANLKKDARTSRLFNSQKDGDDNMNRLSKLWNQLSVEDNDTAIDPFHSEESLKLLLNSTNKGDLISPQNISGVGSEINSNRPHSIRVNALGTRSPRDGPSNKLKWRMSNNSTISDDSNSPKSSRNSKLNDQIAGMLDNLDVEIVLFY